MPVGGQASGPVLRQDCPPVTAPLPTRYPTVTLDARGPRPLAEPWCSRPTFRILLQHLLSVPLPPSRFRTAGTLFALWLMVFTAASQTIIVTPILPLIADELHVAVGRLGLLIGVYSGMLAVAALVMGPVSDRVGRKRVMLVGSAVLAVALALHGLADTFPLLLAVRMLAGAGGGMLSGAAVSYVGDAFPYERRGWATGWVMSGVPFGLVLGIPVGRTLAVALGFRAPFLAFAGVMVVAFVLLLTVVPQPDVERTERPTVGSALRQYRGFLRRPGPAMAALMYFVMFSGLGLLVAYLAEWLSERFPPTVTWAGRPLSVGGVPVDFIATLFLAGGLASVLVGPRAGALSDRLGRRPLILASCLGLTVVTAALPFVVTERWTAYALYVAIMALFAMRMAPFQALLTGLVPSTERGAFLSFTIAVGQIGTALASVLSGALYARYGYAASTSLSAALMALLAYLVWRHLPEPEPQEAEPAAELAA